MFGYITFTRRPTAAPCQSHYIYSNRSRRLATLFAKMSSSEINLKSLPIPSIDRPFGVHLWPIFDKVFTAIAGFRPESFDFKPRVTPMSTLKSAGFTIAAYYVIILGGRELMRNRPAFKFATVFKVHNLYLTAISAILLALFVEELVPIIYNKGIFFAICDHKGGWTNRLVILYYVCITS